METKNKFPWMFVDSSGMRESVFEAILTVISEDKWAIKQKIKKRKMKKINMKKKRNGKIRNEKLERKYEKRSEKIPAWQNLSL